MNEHDNKKGSPWGWSAAGLYGSFVVFILALVAYASFQKFELVDRDYYNKGLEYQIQIDKSVNSMSLTESPDFKFDQRSRLFTVTFHASFEADDVVGMISFFRPSNASLDMAVPINLDSLNRQTIDCTKLVAGLWKIKIDWSVFDKGYYSEQTIVIEK